MKHGSLFSGIGGFDLAAQWMGWENVFHCEWNEFGKRVLSYYWPNAISYNDITKTDFTIHRGGIDILTGGFPCQPYSMAGKRKGKADERHLWPEMLRAIRQIQPRWVVGENVFGIVNWSGGLVFDEVQSDLEAEGYEVQAFVLPACAVNAPHRRDRVWFVAHFNKCRSEKSILQHSDLSTRSVRNNEQVIVNSNDPRRTTGLGEIQSEDAEVSEWHDDAELSNAGGAFTPNATEQGLERSTRSGVQKQGNGFARHIDEQRIAADAGGIGISGQPVDAGASQNAGQRREGFEADGDTWGIGGWENFPTTEPTIRGGDDGLSSRLDGITFSKWRNESIKAYGNAVVPQVVYQIFRAIELYEIQNGAK